MGEAMQQCAAVRTRELAELKLSGYVFKKHAPSCGVDRVRVDSSKNISARRGRGLFAAALMKKRPKKRDRLNNPTRRENFIERVYAYHRCQKTMACRNSQALVQFHTQGRRVRAS
jgi:hypothetical protein